MISAIVMASGFSNRMGINKLILEYKDKPIIEYVFDAVNKSNIRSKIVVTNHEEVIDLGRKNGFNIVFNNNAKLGQSESIKLGIINSPDSLGYAFFTGDQPFINEKVIKLLVDEFNNNPNCIIVPHHNGRRGNPTIFPKEYAKELLNLQGDVGGREIIKKYEDRVKFIEISDKKTLWDIDTIEDYNELLNKTINIKELNNL